MKIIAFIFRVTAVLGMAISVASCGTLRDSYSETAPSTIPTIGDAASARGAGNRSAFGIYVAALAYPYSEIVWVFSPRAGHPLLRTLNVPGTLLPNPFQQIAFDRQGDVYITSHTAVYVFQAGSTTLKQTIQTPTDPYGVAVSPKGLVAINGQNNVAFYKPGATGPCNVIPLLYPRNITAFHPSFDAAGDLFIQYDSYTPYNKGGTLEIRGGCQAEAPSYLNLNYSFLNDFADPVKIDTHNNLVLEGAGSSGSELYMFPPKSTEPSNTVSIGASSILDVAFDDKGSTAWVAYKVSRTTYIDKFAYPTFGSAIDKITTPSLYGVFWDIAVFPPALPGGWKP